MHGKPFTTSLLITTYNTPRRLWMVVRSALNQRQLPDEILIADDGSGEETRQTVEELAAEAFVPVRHLWQPDEGFRAGAARNKAIAAACCDYIIQVDGDVLLHPSFIRDHVRAARRGAFVCGSRAYLTPELTNELERTGRCSVSPREPGVRHAMLNGTRIPLLQPLWRWHHASDPTHTRTHNMAVWRDDMMRVNGFNEDIEGWGLEDSELAWRLVNAGVKKRFLKFGAVQFHLWHPESPRTRFPLNEAIMRRTIEEHITYASNGIVKAL